MKPRFISCNPKPVLVEWVDSSSVHTDVWGSVNEAVAKGTAASLRPCISVGFLVYEDRECLVLVPHLQGLPIDADDSGSGDMTIPRGAVKRVRRLS